MSRARGHRGVILLSVLVVVAIAALVGTTAMYVAEGERAGAEVSIERTRARALAWSGVQAALAELAEQRDVLLTGAAPELTPEWTLYTDENGSRGVVRLVPIGPEGEVAVSELGKLDINTATEEMLAKVEGIGEGLAARIVEERAKRPFESAEDLARVVGVTAELLYGAGDDVDADASSGSGDSRRERPPRRVNSGLGGRGGTRREAGSGASGERRSASGLVDVLTVFAFDANIQAGLGDGGDSHRGKLRINLNTTWSDELGAAVGERFGPDAVRGVEDVFKAGATFKKDADIVGKLREMNAPPPSWGVFLDAFTTCPDPYLIGRVDLSSAPAGVLACVPGLDADTAAEIVTARDRLDEQSRLDPAWPAARKIVPPEKWQEAADRVTTRSLVWRVRVGSGLLPADADDGAELEDRMVLEAVLDVTSERARVAYLREVTLLPLALAMERDLAPTEEESAPESPDVGSAGPGSTDGTERDEAAEPGEDDRARQPAPNAGPDSGERSDTEGLDPSDGSGGAAPHAERGGTPGTQEPAAERRNAPKDRRLGRWTTGGKG